MLFSPRRRREYTSNKEKKIVKDDQHNKIWEYLLEISDILNGGSSDSWIALFMKMIVVKIHHRPNLWVLMHLHI